jgi:YD repeat-containing protein
MFELPLDLLADRRHEALAAALVARLDGGPQQARVDSASGDVLATDALGHSTRFGFGPHGFIDRVVSPLGRTWHLTNDAEGRLHALTDPAGQRLTLNYDDAGRPVRLTRDGSSFHIAYDAAGDPIAVTFPDGERVQLAYAQPGRLARKTDRLGHHLDFRYDSRGRLLAFTDAQGRATRFRYGGWDRPDATELPDGRVEHYAYDAAGRTHRIVLAGAQGATQSDVRLDYAGDSTQPGGIRYDDGESLAFAYDAQGRLLEARQQHGEQRSMARYRYDEQGQLTKETLDDAQVAYHYDRVGRLAAMDYPDGNRVRFGYDADGRLTRVVDWNGGEQHLAHAPGGITRHLPSGVATLNRHDRRGRTVSIEVRPPNGAAETCCHYAYDAQDRLLAAHDTATGTRGFGYDAEGRLSEVAGPDGTTTYAYDPAGNRIAANGARVVYDTADQRLDHRYDALGDTIARTTSSGEWTPRYNRRHLLVAAEHPDGRYLTYAYDAFGRRLLKRDGVYDLLTDTQCVTRETRYLWAGEQLIGERIHDAEGRLARSQDFLYWPGTHTPLATRIDGIVYHYHCDPLGTPQRLMMWLEKESL